MSVLKEATDRLGIDLVEYIPEYHYWCSECETASMKYRWKEEIESEYGQVDLASVPGKTEFVLVCPECGESTLKRDIETP